MSNNPKVDSAFELFHNKKMEAAISAFDGLLADAELPMWVKVRVKQYRVIAERTLADTVGFEPNLKTYSYYVNLGELDKAEDVLKNMGASESDMAYLTSELTMLRGDHEKGFALLKESIKFDEHNLGYALHSSAFQPHVTEEIFEFLRQKDEDAA